MAFALGVGVQLLNGDVLRPECLVALPAVVVLGRLLGLYGHAGRGLGASTLNDIPQHAQLATALALLASLVGDALVEPRWDTGTTLAFWLSMLVGLPVARGVARRLPAALAPERCVVVGDLQRASRVRRTLEGLSGRRSVVVAWVTPEQVDQPGADKALAELIQNHDVEHVVLAPAVIDDGDVVTLLHSLEELGVRVTLMPRLLELASATLTPDALGSSAGLEVRRLALSRTQRLVKRGFDVAVAALLLVCLAPLLVAVAVSVRASSSGPVLFRQQRIGREGRAFWMLKFRTMVVDADARKAELLERNQAEGLFKILDDPRVTRVGRYLRRTSFDELPQLINVLRGEMSLVGPRPLVPEEDCTIAGWHRRRLTVLPGMTGIWQVLGSARIPLHEMVELDNLYVVTWSPWLDVKILLRTAAFVVGRRGL